MHWFTCPQRDKDEMLLIKTAKKEVQKDLKKKLKIRGDRTHNNDPSVNTGILIIARASKKHKNYQPQHYGDCPKCGKTMLRKTLCDHLRRNCLYKNLAHNRAVQQASRSMNLRITTIADDALMGGYGL